MATAKKWALIIDGAVFEVTDLDPEGRFHPDLLWVACAADVGPGWRYANGAFSAPN